MLAQLFADVIWYEIIVNIPKELRWKLVLPNRTIPSIFLSDDSNRSIVYCKITRIDKSDLQIPLEESWSRNINLIRLAFRNSLCSILLIFRTELVVFPLQSPLHTIIVHIHNLRCVPGLLLDLVYVKAFSFVCSVFKV